MFADFTAVQLDQARQILRELHHDVLEYLAGNRAGLRHLCEGFIKVLDEDLTKQQAVDFLVRIYSKALSYGENRLRDSDGDITVDVIKTELEKVAAALGIENEVKQKFEEHQEKDWDDRKKRWSVKTSQPRRKTVKWTDAVTITPFSIPAGLIEFQNGKDYFMKEITSVGINPENGDLYVRTFASDQQKAINLARTLNKRGITGQVGEHIVKIDSADVSATLSHLSGRHAGKFRITPECASSAVSEHQKAIGSTLLPPTGGKGQWTSSPDREKRGHAK